MKNHFFTLDAKEQKEIEMKEAFRIAEDEQSIFPTSETFNLCGTCTKLEDCIAGQFGETILECSDYGQPN